MSGRRYANLLDEPHEQRRKPDSIHLLSNHGLSFEISDLGDNKLKIKKISTDVAILFLKKEFRKSELVYHKHNWRKYKVEKKKCHLIGWNPSM